MTENDGLSEDTAKLKLDSGPEDVDNSIKIATARLAQEARQAGSYPGRGVRDITDLFTSASHKLQPGQLIQDESFTLFEAVGALEIMDPKMDSGVVLPGESIEIQFDPSGSLKADEVLWIMDELLCLEIAWLEGYPLSQTIFTSLHVDRLLDPSNHYPYAFELSGTAPKDGNVDIQLTHKVLHAYCTATVKTCSIVLEFVQSQNFFEEEDFVTHLFGQELLPKLSWEEALAQLDEALIIVRKLKLNSELQDALAARIEFRRIFMRSIYGQVDGWAKLIDLLKTILDRKDSLYRPVTAAFTEKVQRHLATSTPPRPMVKMSRKEAQPIWIKLCNDFSEAPKHTSYWIRQSPACLQKAMWAFSARHPSTLPRAVIQDLMFADGKIAGDVSHFDLLLSDLRDLVLPGDPLADPDSFAVEMVTDVRHKCSRLMETFMDGVLDEYLNLYRMVCLNRCRIRRTFTQAIPLFEVLETSHAAKLDSDINAIIDPKQLDTALGEQVVLNPLTTWVRYYKLQTMALTIHLGFETDIYLPDELGSMYWFLSSVTSERQKLLEHTEAFTRDRMAQHTRDLNARLIADCLVSTEWFTALRADAETTIAISNALWSLYAVLTHLQLIKAPKRQHAQPQLLYEARMKPYLHVVEPPPPTASQLEQARALTQPVDATCTTIQADIQYAKKQLTARKVMYPEAAKYVGTEDRWKLEIKQLETVCVAITVALSQLKTSIGKLGWKEGDGTASLQEQVVVTLPKPGQRYHDWWIVPQIRQKK